MPQRPPRQRLSSNALLVIDGMAPGFVCNAEIPCNYTKVVQLFISLRAIHSSILDP